jgi:hypothetical protein
MLRPALSITGVLCFAPATALAGDGRLSYARLPGAESCPSEQGFRDRVAVQLGGIDPFTAAASRRPDITLAHEGRSFQGTLRFRTGSGAVEPAQEFTGPTCGEVVEDMVLAISIAQRTPKALPSAPALPLSPVDASPPALPAPARRAWFLQIGAGALLAGGFSPGLSVGFAGFAGVYRPSSFFSLHLEGRGDLPSSGGTDLGVNIRTSFAGGSIVPCYRRLWLLACGLLTAGRLQSTALSATQAAFYAGTGPRLGLAVPLLADRLSVELSGDLLFNLTRPVVVADATKPWAMSAVAGLLGLRLATLF